MKRGLLAEFDRADALLAAVHSMRRDGGFRDMDAFTPYPMDEVLEALQVPRSRVPLYALCAGVFGAGYAYLIQFWVNGFDYALNVGGRPLGSVPAYIPPTFEGAVLLASLTAFFAFLGFAGLPQVAAPIFSVPGFERASIDRYFLGLDESDPCYDPGLAERILRRAGALRITVVPVEEVP